MNIEIRRIAHKETYTVGKMYIDGQYFCDTIEDKVRDLTREQKVYAQTAIPAGTYPVVLTYAPKFKKMLPWIQNVPHFTGILIHNGNTAQDSAGCIIIGENTLKGCVLNSLKYEYIDPISKK
jgi:hypothetical protein